MLAAAAERDDRDRRRDPQSREGGAERGEDHAQELSDETLRDRQHRARLGAAILVAGRQPIGAGLGDLEVEDAEARMTAKTVAAAHGDVLQGNRFAGVGGGKRDPQARNVAGRVDLAVDGPRRFVEDRVGARFAKGELGLSRDHHALQRIAEALQLRP